MTKDKGKKKERINIPQPKVLPGEGVAVFNYRRRKRGDIDGGVWEEGEVTGAEYKLSKDGTGYWLYDVLIRRENDKAVLLYVGDEKVNTIL